ncbi:hypothetical protein PBY51_012091 [Eleginops maclovinus]|uniref:Uncharacterized protein n=1 Tax=Eleginops maclovinus TaxID=56733 RepID=A0AAN7XSN2_ELEMC|nr:hypothetical protein PBY51_012091 [Eleginops maclovinus]
MEGWRRGLQLVMKSSLFILRRQSVSGRARGLRGSTAFSACKVCRVPLRSVLCCLCVSTRFPQLGHKETESERPLQS